MEDLIHTEIDEDEDYLYDEDDWEDSAFPARYATLFPGWHQMKITNFNVNKLKEIEAWCIENCTNGKWERVGWNSGCSYSVGIVVEHPRDAMMWRLRWS